MKLFEKSKWIWAKNSLDVDDYAEFIGVFTPKTDKVIVRVSCDTDFALYINDSLVAFMECSDYPHDKFYDEYLVDVHSGVNNFKLDVWHQGVDSQKYLKADHGAIFEVLDGEEVILASNESTQSRVMNEFENGLCKRLTLQQGISFRYKTVDELSSFADSILIDKQRNFSKRKINKILCLRRAKCTVSSVKDFTRIDFGKETVGIPEAHFYSPCDQLIKVAYGEHLEDGEIRLHIDRNSEFSYTIQAKQGWNKMINPLKRFAGRYMEVHVEKEPISIEYIGLRKVQYDHKIVSRDFKDELLNKIYDTCVYTLECCMHEHYEDCPWREQCLYIMDSRNQMLCGYYAFEGFEYQRHNLVLLCKGLQDYGLISICCPTGVDYPIPSFSSMLFQQTYEYIKYSGDRSVLDEIGNTLKTVMKTFTSRVDSTGLIKYFQKPFWNFYEWEEESHNDFNIFDTWTPTTEYDRYELIINAMYVRAAEYYEKIFGEHIDTTKTKESIKKFFYMEDKGVYRLHTQTDRYSQLGNSLACLIGLGSEELIEKIINDKDMITATLSMRTFFYDALLTQGNKYKDYIINDIKYRYKLMLDNGATTFYETEKGAADFGGAGSLCHGWSAIPVYYLSELVK